MAHPIIQAPVSEAYLKMMGVKRVPTVSTLTIGDNYSRVADHPEFVDQPLYAETLEADERQRIKTEESAKQKENRWAAWMKVMTPVAQDNMKRLNEVGKDIVAAGTDQTSGPALHRELELLAGGGISPADVIVIATRNAARALGKQESLGTIEAGKLADLVLLKADPDARHQQRQARGHGHQERPDRRSIETGSAGESAAGHAVAVGPALRDGHVDGVGLTQEAAMGTRTFSAAAAAADARRRRRPAGRAAAVHRRRHAGDSQTSPAASRSPSPRRGAGSPTS